MYVHIYIYIYIKHNVYIYIYEGVRDVRQLHVLDEVLRAPEGDAQAAPGHGHGEELLYVIKRKYDMI